MALGEQLQPGAEDNSSPRPHPQDDDQLYSEDGDADVVAHILASDLAEEMLALEVCGSSPSGAVELPPSRSGSDGTPACSPARESPEHTVEIHEPVRSEVSARSGEGGGRRSGMKGKSSPEGPPSSRPRTGGAAPVLAKAAAAEPKRRPFKSRGKGAKKGGVSRLISPPSAIAPFGQRGLALAKRGGTAPKNILPKKAAGVSKSAAPQSGGRSSRGALVVEKTPLSPGDRGDSCPGGRAPSEERFAEYPPRAPQHRPKADSLDRTLEQRDVGVHGDPMCGSLGG